MTTGPIASHFEHEEISVAQALKAIQSDTPYLTLATTVLLADSGGDRGINNAVDVLFASGAYDAKSARARVEEMIVRHYGAGPQVTPLDKDRRS